MSMTRLCPTHHMHDAAVARAELPALPAAPSDAQLIAHASHAATAWGYRTFGADTGASPDHIPVELLASLHAYVTHRQPPGGFLRAVLENDLAGTHQRAIGRSRLAIPALVMFLHNAAWVPSTCHGSAKRVTAWLSAVDAPSPAGP